MQMLLGVMYEKGIGVRESSESAFEWIQMAASEGDIGAQFLLGRLYACGIGVAKDEDRALALFHEAEIAELQQFYETGFPIWRGDPEGAIQAAESGNSLAQTVVGKNYLTGAGGVQTMSKQCISLNKAQIKLWVEQEPKGRSHICLRKGAEVYLKMSMRQCGYI